MKHSKIEFPQLSPYFYSSFVSTLDGKVIVKKDGYWPIGTENDYEFFTYLRSHADVIIDGKNTALQFGNRTIDTIHRKEFQELRITIGKTQKPEYYIITSSPDDALAQILRNSYNFLPTIITGKDVVIPKSIQEVCDIERVESFENNLSIKHIVALLQQKGFEKIFIDGGPTLLRSFLAENYLHEIFITIAPKIVAGDKTNTLTMIEGEIFSPEEVKQFHLISIEQIDDEVFLQYRITQKRRVQ